VKPSIYTPSAATQLGPATEAASRGSGVGVSDVVKLAADNGRASVTMPVANRERFRDSSEPDQII